MRPMRPHHYWAIVSLAFFSVMFVGTVFIHHTIAARSAAAASSARPGATAAPARTSWTHSIFPAFSVAFVSTAFISAFGFGVIYGVIYPQYRHERLAVCPSCGRRYSMWDSERCPTCGAAPPPDTRPRI